MDNIYLYTERYRGEIQTISMHKTWEGGNKRLLRDARKYKKSGYKVVHDEKRYGEYRYMKLAKIRADGMYEYIYLSFSLELVHE